MRKPHYTLRVVTSAILIAFAAILLLAPATGIPQSDATKSAVPSASATSRRDMSNSCISQPCPYRTSSHQCGRYRAAESQATAGRCFPAAGS